MPSTTASANGNSSQPIYHPASSSANNGLNTATMRRQQHQPSNSQQYHQKQDSIEAIPSSNSIDSAMYERDKQIYKCSTMRQGGKWDPKYKPSILNCPLPEIPKEANESPKKEPEKESHPQPSSYSRTLQRPPLKLPPTAKPIPPPKIDTPTSPPKSSTTLGRNSPALSKKNNENDSQPKPPPSGQQQQQSVQSPKAFGSRNTNSTSLTTTTITPAPTITTTSPNGNNNEASIEIETNINPNDESNYAVTEL